MDSNSTNHVTGWQLVGPDGLFYVDSWPINPIKCISVPGFKAITCGKGQVG